MLGYPPNNFEILLDIKPTEFVLIAISISTPQGSSYKVDAANLIAWFSDPSNRDFSYYNKLNKKAIKSDKL
jgi:hypothetical protein